MSNTYKIQNSNKNNSRYGSKIKFKFEKILSEKAIDFSKLDEDGKTSYYDGLLKDLQASILKHQKRSIAELHFLNFHSQDAAMEFLGSVAKKITTAKEQLEKPKDSKDPILSIYLSRACYELMELPEKLMPNELAFKNGLTNKYLIKSKEEQTYFEKNIHAVISFGYHVDENKIDGINFPKSISESQLYQFLEKESWAEVNEEKSFIELGQLKNPMENDEYKMSEGISNPRFFPGAFDSSINDMRAIRPSDLPPLNLVLRQDKLGNTSFSCGSYGAFMKFQIDEEAIDDLVKVFEEQKIELPLAIANIFGRFKDGTPLTLSENETGNNTNNFNYEELIKTKYIDSAQSDAKGVRCPFHAHVRKSNPRDADSESKRIVRRGMYYKGKDEKGLLFLSFQNSLEKQFEFVLNNWMLKDFNTVNENEKTTFVKTGIDILFSKKGDEYIIPSNWNLSDNTTAEKRKITIPKSIINFRGGLYLFVPSISFFKKLIKIKEVNVNERNIINQKHTPRFEEISDLKDPTQSGSGTKGSIAKFLPGTETKVFGVVKVGDEPAYNKGDNKYIPNTYIHVLKEMEFAPSDLVSK